MKRFPDNLDNFPAQLCLTLLSYDAGVLLSSGQLLLMTGVSTSRFRRVTAEVGAGYTF